MHTKIIKGVLLIIGIFIVLLPILYSQDSFKNVESYKEIELLNLNQNIFFLKFIPFLICIFMLLTIFILAEDNYLTMLLFVFSTNLIYMASLISRDLLGILLILVSFTKNKHSKFILPLLIVIKWPYFVFGTLLKSQDLLKNKKHLLYYIIFSAVLLTLNLIFNIIPFDQILIERNIYFSELGIMHGVGVLIFSLGILGSFQRWNEKKARSISYLLIIILGFFNREASILAGVLSILYAGIFLNTIIKRNWALNTLKIISIIFVITGLLVSFAVHTNNILNSEPTTEKIEVLNWLKNNSEGKILTDPDYKYWLNYHSNLEILDERIALELFEMKNSDNIIEKLEQNNVSHIFIDETMKEKFWPNKKKMYFVLENSNSFKKDFVLENEEAWSYSIINKT